MKRLFAVLLTLTLLALQCTCVAESMEAYAASYFTDTEMTAAEWASDPTLRCVALAYMLDDMWMATSGEESDWQEILSWAVNGRSAFGYAAAHEVEGSTIPDYLSATVQAEETGFVTIVVLFPADSDPYFVFGAETYDSFDTMLESYSAMEYYIIEGADFYAAMSQLGTEQ